MKDPTVLRMLAELGMDDLSYRALPLLPLVEVAWADAAVQDPERKLLQSFAEQRFDAGEEGLRFLNDWLRYGPSPAYFRKGREALAALLSKEPEHGLGDKVAAEVVELARQIAKSAGGVFGIGATSRAEQSVIDAIDHALTGAGGPRSAVPASEPLASAFGATKGPNRVTITFSSTTTMEAAASGGVLEADGQKFAVDRKGLVIGSGEGADLKIEHDSGVAAAHCRVHETNRKFYVTATDESAPTLVNGERIGDRRLIGGETLRIGQLEVVFKLLRKIPKQLV